MFLTSFEGRSFIPHQIIPSFLMQLEGKPVCVEVEVVNVPLEYNILLGRSWTYNILSVVCCVAVLDHFIKYFVQGMIYNVAL
jgi:hypothetical protein